MKWNAYAERWVQSLRTECLDHFLVCGENHLAYLVREYVAHYNLETPHQALGNVPLPEADESEPRVLQFPSGEVPRATGRRLEALLPRSGLSPVLDPTTTTR